MAIAINRSCGAPTAAVFIPVIQNRSRSTDLFDHLVIARTTVLAVAALLALEAAWWAAAAIIKLPVVPIKLALDQAGQTLLPHDFTMQSIFQELSHSANLFAGLVVDCPRLLLSPDRVTALLEQRGFCSSDTIVKRILEWGEEHQRDLHICGFLFTAAALSYLIHQTTPSPQPQPIPQEQEQDLPKGKTDPLPDFEPEDRYEEKPPRNDIVFRYDPVQLLISIIGIFAQTALQGAGAQAGANAMGQGSILTWLVGGTTNTIPGQFGNFMNL